MGGFYYNTNGLAFHRLADAVDLLADLGYDGVALTPDVHHLDPLRATQAQVKAFGAQLRARGLGVVLETGARFVLDPRRKHRPSLLDDEAQAGQRLSFLKRCVDMAATLEAPVVSVWSGNGPSECSTSELRARLVRGLRALCDYAATRDVRIGFEPEPGMEIERVADYASLRDEVARENLGLTLDVGHCLATREGAPEHVLAAFARDLLVLQLDDHRAGVHEHLMFGEGEVDFAVLGQAIAAAGFDGPLEIELSRHSSSAVQTAAESLAFLKRAFAQR